MNYMENYMKFLARYWPIHNTRSDGFTVVLY